MAWEERGRREGGRRERREGRKEGGRKREKRKEEEDKGRREEYVCRHYAEDDMTQKNLKSFKIFPVGWLIRVPPFPLVLCGSHWK